MITLSAIILMIDRLQASQTVTKWKHKRKIKVFSLLKEKKAARHKAAFRAAMKAPNEVCSLFGLQKATGAVSIFLKL